MMNVSRATNLFLAESGGLGFENVRFRPGASFTTEFGLDNTFGKLRIHNATDRDKGDIFAPFRIAHAEFHPSYYSFGTLLILHTCWGFSVRIAHMEKLSDALLKAISENKPIASGTYLGQAGRAGLSVGFDGRHTHVEIVSGEATSPVLDDVLAAQYGAVFDDKEYDEASIIAYGREKGLGDMVLSQYEEERKKRNVFFLNQFVCDRLDYHTVAPRRFYSSRRLFGM